MFPLNQSSVFLLSLQTKEGFGRITLGFRILARMTDLELTARCSGRAVVASPLLILLPPLILALGVVAFLSL
jgi:hypothetical protein